MTNATRWQHQTHNNEKFKLLLNSTWNLIRFCNHSRCWKRHTRQPHLIKNTSLQNHLQKHPTVFLIQLRPKPMLMLKLKLALKQELRKLRLKLKLQVVLNFGAAAAAEAICNFSLSVDIDFALPLTHSHQFVEILDCILVEWHLEKNPTSSPGKFNHY